VISPDNRSRMEINERIHAELQRSGLVSNGEHRIRTLVPRQDLTGADRTWAERYEVGDVLRYSRASKETGIGKGAYAQVKSIDAPTKPADSRAAGRHERTYDPRRQQGVSVFRERGAEFFSGRPHPVRRAGQRTESCEPRVGLHREHRRRRAAAPEGWTVAVWSNSIRASIRISTTVMP
jgi:hypothetical protein